MEAPHRPVIKQICFFAWCLWIAVMLANFQADSNWPREWENGKQMGRKVFGSRYVGRLNILKWPHHASTWGQHSNAYPQRPCSQHDFHVSAYNYIIYYTKWWTGLFLRYLTSLEPRMEFSQALVQTFLKMVILTFPSSHCPTYIISGSLWGQNGKNKNK